MELQDLKTKQTLLRELKKVRSFEIQKLCKRIRTLKGKKGNEQQLKKNERKVSRLLQELECMKDANLENLAEKIISSDISAFEICDSEVMNPERRALSKLANSKYVKSKFNELTRDSEKGDGFKGMSGGVKQNSMKDEQKERSEAGLRKRKAKGGQIFVQFAKDDKNDDDGMFLCSDPDDVHDLTGEDDEDGLRNERKAGEDEITKEVENKQKKKNATQITSGGFQQEYGSSDEELLGMSEASNNKTSLVSSTFVNLKNDSNEKKERSKIRTEKNSKGKGKSKNRMGQRERRKLWEKKYGVQASHKKSAQKEKRENLGNEKRFQRGAGKSTAKENKIVKTKNKEDEKLHPSWEASKRKKMQQKVEFQGQKIVFGEDD